MGLFDFWRKINRKSWYVCYACMHASEHDALKSVFYYEGRPVEILGRLLTQCPRCSSTNTVSFQKLKEDGSESALWSLEQLVRKYPRHRFEVKSTEIGPA